jgi:hypothetical protein
LSNLLKLCMITNDTILLDIFVIDKYSFVFDFFQILVLTVNLFS